MTGDEASLNEWANRIDHRIGPISGRDADNLAIELRAAAFRIGLLETVLRAASGQEALETLKAKCAL